MIDINNESSEPLGVQPVEIKLATCFQVVLNAGWSISKENWEDMLEVSGVTEVRQQYWDAYNDKKQEIV